MRTATLTILATALLATAPAWPCGPYPYVIRFWNDWQPDDRAAYCSGELGTIGARYGVRDLWIAYRILEGLPVDRGCAAEIEAPASDTSAALARWTEARRRVVATDPEHIDPVRWEDTVSTDGSRHYEAWDNCLADAFETAATTLEQRIAERGVDNPGVPEWVTAQDQVFANCGGGRSIPPEAPGDWAAWRRADRAYQIAAAHLYSRGYAEAEQHFRRIAADPQSPWRETADYLIARALGRAGETAAAIDHLRGLLANPGRASWHPAAERLLTHLRHRHEPSVLLDELAQKLSLPEAPEDPRQDLIDLGRLVRGGFESEHPLVLFLRAGWVGEEEGAAAAAARAATSADPRWWLAAALAHARAVAEDDPWSHPRWPTEAREGLAAALLEHVPPAAGPGTLAVGYHHLRLLATTGGLRAEQQKLEELLAGPLSPSDHNRLSTLWRELADDLPTYLQRSLMTPVQEGWWYGEGGGFLDPADESGARSTLLDPSAAVRIDDAPPAELRALARLPQLPAAVTKQLLSVALTRLILAGDLPAATAAAAELRPFAPELDAAIATFLDAKAERRQFVGLLLLLEAPGLEPILHGGLGRGSRPTILPLDEIENFGANWWCGASTVESPWSMATTQHAPLAIGRPLLEWADTHRDDADVPRALSRLVRATRFACGRGVGAFAEVSRGAFERLHRRYPKSEWATNTPYWYE